MLAEQTWNPCLSFPSPCSVGASFSAGVKMQWGSRSTAGLPDHWIHHGPWHSHRGFLNMHFITARIEGKRSSVFQRHLHHLPATHEHKFQDLYSRTTPVHVPTRMNMGTSSCTQPLCREKTPAEGWLILSVFPWRMSSFLSLCHQITHQQLCHFPQFPASRHLAHCNMLLPALLSACFSSAAARIRLS